MIPEHKKNILIKIENHLENEKFNVSYPIPMLISIISNLTDKIHYNKDKINDELINTCYDICCYIVSLINYLESKNLVKRYMENLKE